MDTAQWPQDIGLVKPMDHHHHHHQQQISPNNNSCNRPNIGVERRTATRPQEQLNCPRCNSTNTKFCYYNNYSLTQPRYFCKGCRRYWTEGGSLRNVPVGGGSRKNKRSSSTSSSTTSSSYKLPDLNPPRSSVSHDHHHHHHQNPNNKTHHHGQDLNLAFQATTNHQDQQQHQGTFIQLPKMENHHDQESNNQHNTSSSSALDLLRTGIATRGLMSSFIPTPMPDSNTLYSSSNGFTLQEFKPTLSFPVDALGSRYGAVQVADHDHQNGGASAGRLFFPFGDFNKQLAGATEADDQDKGQGNATRYWNGSMLQGGGSWERNWNS